MFAPQLPFTGSLISAPLQAAFSEVFITVQELPATWNLRSIQEFQLNVSSLQLQFFDYPFSSGTASTWEYHSAPQFWIRPIVACYQWNADEDHDPDAMESCGLSINCPNLSSPYYPTASLPSHGQEANEGLGFTAANNIWPRYAPPLTLLFLETIRDHSPYVGTQRWQVVAHEVAHGTVSHTWTWKSEQQEHDESGLMDPDNLDMNTELFSSATKARLRNTNVW